jgi:Transposase
MNNSFHIVVPRVKGRRNRSKGLVPNSVRIPLDGISAKDLPELASLPWGSRVTLRSDKGSMAVISGPAKLGTRWYLPVIARSQATRKHGISEASFYNWKAKYGGLEVSEAKRLKGLESENARLKKLLAESRKNEGK